MIGIMNRRALILAMAGAALSGAASASPSAETPAESETFNLTGVGLPIIVGGRVRNYVFLVVKLHLGRGHALDSVKAKEAYLRDALVRAAHRTPFVLADDWNQLDVEALSASLIRSGDALVGKGAIVRVEVVSQSARRRVAVRSV